MKIIEKFTDLDKANAYITGINTAYTTSVDEAKASNDKVKLIEKDLAASKSEAEKANSTTEKALAEVATLSAKLDLQEKHKGENIVTIEKKNYKLLGNRFFVDGAEVTAEGLMKNKTELARMLKIQSGSLVEVESK